MAALLAPRLMMARAPPDVKWPDERIGAEQGDASAGAARAVAVLDRGPSTGT
jgi:hypothetical protein